MNQTRYNETACIAEEREFLKEYTIPFAQLDPMKTILVFSHAHNTFDKRRLLENANPTYVKESDKTVDMFIRFSDEAKIKRFFLKDLDEKLSKYGPGAPGMKPDVIKQTLELEEQRKKIQPPAQIMMQQPGKDPVQLDAAQIIELINGLRSNMKTLTDRNTELEGIVKLQDKSVTFSDPIVQPSISTQKLKKEIAELEFKLKHSALTEAELRAEIEMLRNPTPTSTPVSVPIVFNEKKKSDPEVYTFNRP